MTLRNQIYHCDVCGNIIEVLHKGADALICCNQPMVLKESQTKDFEFNEKHAPIIEGNKIKIGSIEHPMDEKHYIEWIEAIGEKGQRTKIFLKPLDKPEIEFCFKPIFARTYCNIHGLWEAKK